MGYRFLFVRLLQSERMRWTGVEAVIFYDVRQNDAAIIIGVDSAGIPANYFQNWIADAVLHSAREKETGGRVA